jgi:predicted nucleotidyltransferase component of viral defense system
MITADRIKQLAIKYQTTELNVTREYFQYLFLSYFYQQPLAGSIYFKGGTALRVIYRSPRFSEDLDFSASEVSIDDLEQTLLQTLDAIEKENITVSLSEAKTTTGGYFSAVSFESIGIQRVIIQIQISFRRDKLKGEIVTAYSEYTLPFEVNGLAQKLLVGEKVQALFDRKKPRDFYDLYFILRADLLSPSGKKDLSGALDILNKININFEYELKIYLPRSHWIMIKDLKKALEGEIKRFN